MFKNIVGSIIFILVLGVLAYFGYTILFNTTDSDTYYEYVSGQRGQFYDCNTFDIHTKDVVRFTIKPTIFYKREKVEKPNIKLFSEVWCAAMEIEDHKIINSAVRYAYNKVALEYTAENLTISYRYFHNEVAEVIEQELAKANLILLASEAQIDLSSDVIFMLQEHKSSLDVKKNFNSEYETIF